MQTYLCMSETQGVFSTRPRGWKRVRRQLVATFRDLRILAREFWLSIVVFLALLLVGGGLISSHYHEGGERMTYGKAVYSAFTMIFFQGTLKFPEDQLDLQVLFYAIPILGLFVVVEGIARFGHLAINKNLRGEEWQRIVASTFSDHIVLCGLGHIGFRVAEQLHDLGQEIVVISRESPFVERVKRAGVPVVTGDARDVTLLEAAGLRQARSIIVATDDDLANLDIVLSAREMCPSIRTVVRLFDAELGKKMQRALGIDMVFSTSSLTAPAVALGAMSRNVLHSFHVGSALLSVGELEVGEGCPYVGQTLEAFQRAENLTVVVHRAQQAVRIHPESTDLLSARDGLLFLADLSTIERLLTRGFLAPSGAGALGTTLGMRVSGLSPRPPAQA